MTDSIVEPATGLNAEQVADFLKNNPEFFIDRDDLLMQMKLPHKRGSTISLVERQLKLLRDRDTELHRRLELLVSTAKDNDRRFESIRKLTLSLLESRDLEQAIEAVKDSLDHDFNIEFHQLILFSNQPKTLPVRIESKDVAESILGIALSDGSVFCGSLDDKQTGFLFGKQADKVKSVTVAPLNFPERIGILTLGSRDEKQFRASMGTLFIGYLGDVLSRHLAHLIQLSDKKTTSKKKR